MNVKELITILQRYPQDAQIFVSHLSLGDMTEDNINYHEETNVVKFE